jgi:hypothetical protein
MKKIMILALCILLYACAIKPVCHLDNQVVKITGYHKSTKTVECENLSRTCFASFTCNQKVQIGDTVKVEVVNYGSVAGNRLPVCTIKKLTK